MARKKIEVVSEPTSTCKSCKHAFFSELTYCRRYPPVASFDSEGAHVDSCWPVVDVTDYCGEFAAHLSS